MSYLFCGWLLAGCLSPMCLAQAPTGTIKKKLDQVCENLVTHDLKGDYIERELNLDRPEVSSYLEAVLNSLPARGKGTQPGDIFRSLILAHPSKTVEWLMDHYDQFSPIGLMNMTYSLCNLESRESFQILLPLLEDRRVIFDVDAAAVSAPPYWHRRVCDHAFIAVTHMVQKGKILPRGFLGAVTSHQPPEERDKEIQRFKDWWAQESEVILRKAPPLAATRPSLQNKVESVLRKAATKSDSKIGTRK